MLSTEDGIVRGHYFANIALQSGVPVGAQGRSAEARQLSRVLLEVHSENSLRLYFSYQQSGCFGESRANTNQRRTSETAGQTLQGHIATAELRRPEEVSARAWRCRTSNLELET